MKISEKIINYAIWYYLKYFPSKKKLENKLIEKFWEKSENWQKFWWIWKTEIDFIFEEKLRNILQEEQIIESKIRGFIEKGKSKNYIKFNLLQKLFDCDLINKYLEISFFSWEKENLEKEFAKILRKNNLNLDDFSNLDFKSKQKILEKLLRKGFKYDDIKRL